MATVDKNDIKGSQLTFAYREYLKDSAIRRFYVTASSSDNKNSVITAVKTRIGDFHPELSNLPLQTITATRVGIYRWLVIAKYDRSVTFGLPTQGGRLAGTQTAFESLPIYTDLSNFEFGVPRGELAMPAINIGDPDKRSSIERKIWQRPVIKYKWPFDLGIHPSIYFRNAAGTLNQTQLLIGGISHPARRMRYDGFVSKARYTRSGVRYTGFHSLTYSGQSEWLAQDLFYDDNNLRWDVELRDMYTVGSWAPFLT